MSGKNIHQRIAAVMEAVTYVQKEKKLVNKQYRFVSHDAVTAAIQPELVKNGIVAIPSVTNHTQDGNRTSVDLKIDFVNVDKPDDKVSVDMFGYGVDAQDKGPGKAFSYAKKYAFLQLFCLSTGDDPERDNIDHKPEEKQPTQQQGACKKGGSQNKDWAGPLVKDQLHRAYLSYLEDFEGSQSIDDIDELSQSDDFKIFFDQAESDWPNLLTGWKGPEGEWNTGVRQAYDNRRRELEQLAQ